MSKQLSKDDGCKALHEYLELFDALGYFYKYHLAPKATLDWFGSWNLRGAMRIHHFLVHTFNGLKHVNFNEPKMVSLGLVDEEDVSIPIIDRVHSHAMRIVNQMDSIGAVTPPNCKIPLPNYPPPAPLKYMAAIDQLERSGELELKYFNSLRQLVVMGTLRNGCINVEPIILRLRYRRRLKNGAIRFESIVYEHPNQTVIKCPQLNFSNYSTDDSESLTDESHIEIVDVQPEPPQLKRHKPKKIKEVCRAPRNLRL